MDQIGQKIKDLRKKADLTQDRLADYLGVTAQAVSKWEVGSASPDLSLIAPLCRVFGVSADELLGIGPTAELPAAEEPDSAKRKILITACYILEAERNEFWDARTGRLTGENDRFLKSTAFPEALEFPGGLPAKRYYVKHRIADDPRYNFLLCPICGRALTNPAKPFPICELDPCVTVDGVGLCACCADQLDLEIKRNGIAEVIRRYRDESTGTEASRDEFPGTGR